MPSKPVWNKEWPKEPGLYWFYGYRSRLTDTGCTLHVVRAHRRGVSIVIEGLFPVAADGYFSKLEHPPLPEWT